MDSRTRLHLHHAITFASHAIASMSDASMWAEDQRLSDQAVANARLNLKRAVEEFEQYDAKRRPPTPKGWDRVEAGLEG